MTVSISKMSIGYYLATATIGDGVVGCRDLLMKWLWSG